MGLASIVSGGEKLLMIAENEFHALIGKKQVIIDKAEQAYATLRKEYANLLQLADELKTGATLPEQVTIDHTAQTWTKTVTPTTPAPAPAATPTTTAAAPAPAKPA